MGRGRKQYEKGKILKNNQIIGHIWFYGNNYEIGNDKIGKMAFATLAADLTTLKNSRPYKEPHSAAISDTWHYRMGHIGRLGLHMLGKDCLGV